MSDQFQYVLRTWGDLADVGFSLVTLGVVPGPVEGAWTVHAHAALVLNVAGLSWSPLSEKYWPAVCPRVGAILLRYKKISAWVHWWSLSITDSFGWINSGLIFKSSASTPK